MSSSCQPNRYNGFERADPKRYRTIPPPRREEIPVHQLRPALRGNSSGSHGYGRGRSSNSRSSSAAPDYYPPRSASRQSQSTFNPFELLLMLAIGLVVLVTHGYEPEPPPPPVPHSQLVHPPAPRK